MTGTPPTPSHDIVKLLLEGEAIRGDYQKMWMQSQIDLGGAQKTIERLTDLLVRVQKNLEANPDTINLDMLLLSARIEEEIGPLEGREVHVDEPTADA